MGKKSQSIANLIKLNESWHDVCTIREITNSNDGTRISLDTAAGKIGFLPCPQMSMLKTHRRWGSARMGDHPGFHRLVFDSQDRTALAGISRLQELMRKCLGATSCVLGWVTLGCDFKLGQSQSWPNERMRLCQGEKWSIIHYTYQSELYTRTSRECFLEINVPVPYLLETLIQKISREAWAWPFHKLLRWFWWSLSTGWNLRTTS